MKNMIKIAKYDLEGNFLEVLEGETLSEIAKSEKVQYLALKRSIEGGTLSCNNFQYRMVDSTKKVLIQLPPVWRLVKGPTILKRSMFVGKYYKGKLVSTYRSLTELCKKNNIPDFTGISLNLRNGKEHNTKNGFTFKKLN